MICLICDYSIGDGPCPRCSGPMSEASTADIRAWLDEHRMFRGHCIGCVRRFGGPRHECLMRPELDALRAVLDLIEDVRDDLPDWLAQPVLLRADEIERAIADALGVQRATPPAEPSTHEFEPFGHFGTGLCDRGVCDCLSKPQGCIDCGEASDHPVHEQRATPPAETYLACAACGYWDNYHPETSWPWPVCPDCGRHQQRGERAERGNNTEGDRA